MFLTVSRFCWMNGDWHNTEKMESPLHHQQQPFFTTTYFDPMTIGVTQRLQTDSCKKTPLSYGNQLVPHSFITTRIRLINLSYGNNFSSLIPDKSTMDHVNILLPLSEIIQFTRAFDSVGLFLPLCTRLSVTLTLVTHP